MFSDLLWFIILLSFALPGFKHPYIALCGAVFIEILRPQSMSFSFLAGKPIFLIMVLILFLSLLINAKKLSMPKEKFLIFLFVIFMIWITITTYYAQFPHVAWIKYDMVIKTMAIALLIPFILNTRVRLDTFIAIYAGSVSFYTLVIGIKTFAGSGGYGNALISSNGTSLLAESSTMSMVAIFNIPLILYLKNHSIFKARLKFIRPTSNILILSSIMAVVGTYARTGLVGLFVLINLMLKSSKKKLKYISIIILSVILMAPLAPETWKNRMGTIFASSEDSSAFGRVVVWKWTIDYVNQKPIMGGGFHSYLANAGQLQQYIDSDIIISHTQKGKAFHNIFFEVLGETGYVGLFLYFCMIFFTYLSFKKVERKSTDDRWVYLARACTQALYIYSVCGLFIGVAFYPWLYYLLGLAVSLNYIAADTMSHRGKLSRHKKHLNSRRYKQALTS